MSRALEQASELIPPEDAFRRFVGYVHPEVKTGATHTVLLGAQLVNPGERPEAHRHTMAAIRFVVSGGGAATVVNGEEFPMEEGDLITTPSRTWHDHANESGAPIVWLDGADGPLMRLLRVGDGNLFPKPLQDVVRGRGTSAAETGVIRPAWIQPEGAQPPPYRYTWAETQRVLDLMAEEPGDPYDGLLLRYLNPTTGGPTLPTLGCEMQMLRPGERTQGHQHTSSVVYHAFRGRGRTMIDGETLEWEKGDTFVVPLWCAHRHENDGQEPAYLFSISDRPVMEQLGLYREEPAETAASIPG
jgi:gentisate 1,2-dioxygenase